jgi:hypothetical protein
MVGLVKKLEIKSYLKRKKISSEVLKGKLLQFLLKMFKQKV